MHEAAISVLIPVCNTEKYVRECLDSVVGQSLKNLEIICLDDGSTDSSPAILDEYAERDDRIRVIHKENTGFGSTMNRGLELAVGKYIAIVESDDFIVPEMLEKLYEIAEKNSLDFIRADFAKFWGEKEERMFEYTELIPYESLYGRVLDREDIKTLFRGYILNQSGIYRREFLWENRILHHETPGASYQDAGFFFQIMMKASRGYLLEDHFYCYRQDNPFSSVKSKGKVFCICEEMAFIERKIREDAEVFGEYLPVYQMFRLGNYRFNIKRIAEEYRREFLEREREEFCLSEQAGEMDLSFMTDEEKRSLEKIMNDPEEYLRETFQNGKRLYEKAGKYSELIFYGAGAKGNEVFEDLKEYLEEFDSVCYAVSERNSRNKIKNGLEIKWIEELRGKAKTAAVIVAVSERYQEEMKENLKRLGFRHIISPDGREEQ